METPIRDMLTDADGPSDVWLELEFKTEGGLKDFVDLGDAR